MVSPLLPLLPIPPFRSSSIPPLPQSSQWTSPVSNILLLCSTDSLPPSNPSNPSPPSLTVSWYNVSRRKRRQRRESSCRRVRWRSWMRRRCWLWALGGWIRRGRGLSVRLCRGIRFWFLRYVVVFFWFGGRRERCDWEEVCLGIEKIGQEKERLGFNRRF